VVYQNSSAVQLIRDDGSYLLFSSCSGAWCADADETGTLTELTSGSTITGWQFVDGNDVVETYNASGQLTSETSRSGIVHTLSYDGSGRLSTVTDSFGLQLSFSYDSSSRVYQITEPGSGVITYAYDSSGNFSTVTYPDSSVRTYLYDESGDVASGANPYLLTGIQDESSNRFATYTYDSQTRAISSQHAGGADALSLTYNSDGTTTAVDALSASRTYTFTTILQVNHVTAVSGPECSSCGLSASYTLNSNGDVSATTDFNSNVTTYSVDSRHLEESRTEASGSSNARTITTAWSSSFRVPTSRSVYTGGSATGTPLRTTSFTYDSSGNQLTKTITDPATSATRTWTYTYDSYGHVLTIDGPRTDVSDVTTYTYYSCTTGYPSADTLHTATDAAGNVTTVYNTYNANGQPLTITDPNGVAHARFTYDARQRLELAPGRDQRPRGFAYYPTGLCWRP
jgi:YD repeat-containing protein